MNRAQAIEALQAGKKVEREHRCVTTELRWDREHGIQFCGGAGVWENEAGDPKCVYREAWAPRVFLDVWEEVKTFDEAEPAGTNVCGDALAMYAYWRMIGGVEIDSGVNGPSLGSNGCWVRRKAGK